MAQIWREKVLGPRYLLPAIFVLFLLIPVIRYDPWMLRGFILANTFAIFALSWDLISGYMGMLSFGHAFFFGSAAYASALLSLHFGMPPVLGIFVSAVLCGGLGLLMGYPCLRMRGIYLAVLTLAFPLVLSSILYIWPEIFGREFGVSGYANLSLSTNVNYYTSLLLLACSAAIALILVNSNIGLIMKSIRDNEEASASIGVNPVKYKLLAFVMAGFLAGIAGSFNAYFIRGVTADVLMIDTSFLPVFMGVIGGMGTILGPILGAYVLIFADHYLLMLIPQFKMIIYGLLVIMMLFLKPGGLLGGLKLSFRNEVASGSTPSRQD